MLDEWILNTLKEELESAKRRHEEAKEKILEKMRKDGGTRVSFGSQMFRDALAEERHASKAHLDALMRINTYLINGTVPEDLGEKKSEALNRTRFSG